MIVIAVLVGAVVLLQYEPTPGRPRLGAPLPEFELSDLMGVPHHSAALAGQVVFLNFWASWCAPCREEAPALERLYMELQDEGLVIWAVSIDASAAENEILAFRDEFGLSFPIFIDPEKELYRRLGATGVPESFLIDAEGHLVEHFIGPRSWDDPRYARAIRRLLTAAAGEQDG